MLGEAGGSDQVVLERSKGTALRYLGKGYSRQREWQVLRPGGRIELGTGCGDEWREDAGSEIREGVGSQVM